MAVCEHYENMPKEETLQPTIEPSGLEKPETNAGDAADRKTEEVEGQAPTIGVILERINALDEKIADLSASLEVNRTQLDEARQGLDVAAVAESSPSQRADTDRLVRLQEEKAALDAQKDGWISEHGRENLPEGMVMPAGQNGGEMRAGSLRKQAEEDDSDPDQEKNLDARKVEMDSLKRDVTRAFEQGLKNSWRTRGAANLEMVVDLMKIRSQKAIDNKSADYVSGKTDELPFEDIWLSWEATSIIDRLFGKPNLIKNVNIFFDDDLEPLINASEIAEMEDRIKKDAERTSPKPGAAENQPTSPESPEQKT